MRKKTPGPENEEREPGNKKILQAMEFYRAVLKDGPRNPREVLAEGLKVGHTKKTQERARLRLHVQKIPPTTWQGPWLIALPDDPIVDAARQRKEKKNQKKLDRQGNGRRKNRNGSNGKPSGSHLMPVS